MPVCVCAYKVKKKPHTISTVQTEYIQQRFSETTQHWLPKWQQQQQMKMEKQRIHLVKIKMCPNHEIVLHICGLFEYTEHIFSMGRTTENEREAEKKT